MRALLALIPAIALRYPIKKWAALAALASAAFYLVISGAATPATRAFVMLATMLLAVLFDRPALSMRSLGLAATIILMLRPENLLEPGFQMSFSAVVSLIAVAEWEQARRARRMEPRGPQRFAAVRRYMRGIATTSLVGSLATAPSPMFHFDRATHYAVLGNLLAMPVMGFVTMPGAALWVMADAVRAWRLSLACHGLGHRHHADYGPLCFRLILPPPREPRRPSSTAPTRTSSSTRPSYGRAWAPTSATRSISAPPWVPSLEKVPEARAWVVEGTAEPE